MQCYAAAGIRQHRSLTQCVQPCGDHGADKLLRCCQRPDRPAHNPNMSDVDALSSDGTVFGSPAVQSVVVPGDADDEPHEIEPYDDGPDA